MPALSAPFQRALLVSAATGSFAVKAPTVTAPSGPGVFTLNNQANTPGEISRFVQLVPFGSSANNQTFDLRLWAWSLTTDNPPVWIPQLLVELNVTLGNIVATVLGTSHFIADTIAIAKGDANAPLITPVADCPASILVHLRGAHKIEFDFDLTGAAAANCLWRSVD